MKTLLFYCIVVSCFVSCSSEPEKQNPVTLSQNKFDSLVILAHNAKMGEDMLKAEKIMDDIVACDSNNPTYLVERALVMVPFKMDKVMKDAHKAIILNPNYSRAFYAKGLAWGSIGNPDSAIY